MTTDPPRGPRNDPDDPLVQMNVRVPTSLRDRIDARRHRKGLSRDVWVTRALTAVLDQTVPPQALSNQKGRTAPPPHRR